MARLFGQDEFRNRHAAPFTHAPPVEFDSRDLMKSFGREIAGSAMWAANDGALSQSPAASRLFRSYGLLVELEHQYGHSFGSELASCYSAYTVRIYSIWPEAPNFATTRQRPAVDSLT